MIELPIKTVGGLNAREFHMARSRRVKAERHAGQIAAKQEKTGLPCVVTLTRLSAGELDDDNLQGSMKAIRDGIADILGVPDNDKRIKWVYAQERCERGYYAVRVKVDVVTSVDEALTLVEVK